MNGHITAWQVTVTTDHDHPVSDNDLARLAQLGGVATPSSGDRRRTVTTVSVELGRDESIDAAGGIAVAQVHGIVPGRPVAVEIVAVDELHDRSNGPAFPELAGLAELAGILGISRQTASFLPSLPGFPPPVASLRSGPVWRKSDLYRYADERRRSPRRLTSVH